MRDLVELVFLLLICRVLMAWAQVCRLPGLRWLGIPTLRSVWRISAYAGTVAARRDPSKGNLISVTAGSLLRVFRRRS